MSSDPTRVSLDLSFLSWTGTCAGPAGFFVCKLKKLSNAEKVAEAGSDDSDADSADDSPAAQLPNGTAKMNGAVGKTAKQQQTQARKLRQSEPVPSGAGGRQHRAGGILVVALCRLSID